MNDVVTRVIKPLSLVAERGAWICHERGEVADAYGSETALQRGPQPGEQCNQDLRATGDYSYYDCPEGEFPTAAM